MHECDFCHNIFKTVPSLKVHQKTAKYCLILRDKHIPSCFMCDICQKKFTSNRRLLNHKHKCGKSMDTMEVEIGELKITIKQQEQKIFSLQQSLEQKDTQLNLLLEQKDTQIHDLQNKLQEIALRAVSRPTTTKNTQINNYIQKMECVTDEHLQDQVQHLTIDHIQKGPEGYAEYALEYPLKNRIVCVDYARRKVKFKDKDGSIVTDPEMSIIATKLFQSIQDKNKELIFSYGNELKDRLGEEMDTLVQLLDYKTNVENSAEGSKPDFFHDFVKSVCGKCVHD